MSTTLTDATFTSVELKNVAKQIELAGRSKLKKDDLLKAIVALPQGRKALYMILEAAAAVATIEDILATGKPLFTLQRPAAPAKVVTPTGTFTSFQDLGKAAGATDDKAFVAWKFEMDKYNCKKRALKTVIIERKLSHLIRWNEPDNGSFHLAYVGKPVQKAEAV